MSAQDGMDGGVQAMLPRAMIDGAFTAIAWYNVIELNVIIQMTFKRRKGLYFYSLLVASWGIAVYALASIMKLYQAWQNNYVSVTFITIGWYAMVTGQSLVQYSRLHLVFHDHHKIKWVLWMIIINVFLFHVPTTVMTFGVSQIQLSLRCTLADSLQTNSPLVDLFSTPYSVMEKIQMTAFTIQESIISGLYVYKTRWILSHTLQKNRGRRVMMQLIIVNALIILMDLTILGTEYANQYEIETTYKGALYSVKLKLEFAVLGQLMSLVRPDISTSDYIWSDFSPSNSHTVDARDIRKGTIRQSRPDNHSKTETIVFTSAADQLQFPGKTHEKGVMMTTEIAVNHESAHQLNSGAKTNCVRLAPDLSPTSSQVEFARDAC
jgi:hypothetical protein